MNNSFIIKHTTQKLKARIDSVRYVIDVNTYHRTPAETLNLNQIGRLVITSSRPLYFDSYTKNRQTGSFILIDPMSHNTVAVGMIIDRVTSEKLPSRITNEGATILERSLITSRDREKQLGQSPMTYWITGLHASGKNELGYRLEKHLFDQGKTVVVLDGSRLRGGINRELGHHKADRDENLRRVAEMAKLLNEQGLIVIAIFISPDRETRLQVRGIIGPEYYKEIFINTTAEDCKLRDKTGLYMQAESGVLDHFPGVQFDYEMGTADVILENMLEIEFETILKW